MKAYIYCTKAVKRFTVEHQGFFEDDLTLNPDNGNYVFGTSFYIMSAKNKYTKDNFLNGKVIASFELNDYTKIETNFKGDYDEDKESLTQEPMISLIYALRLNYEDFIDYIGKGPKESFVWHLDNLEKFKVPKQLNQFYSFTKKKGMIPLIDKPIARAPQSWQYALDEDGDKCIIISIKPWWCWNILEGIKKMELRKSIPTFLKPKNGI